MSLHADLLEQAKHLASRETKRPKQASLRRAVSSAYYALFHLLTHEASSLFVSDPVIVASINRTLNHGEMNRASKHIVGNKLPKALVAHISGMAAAPATARLQKVAQAFIDLQQARHEADYNLAKRFRRGEVASLLNQAEQAFADWNEIRKSDYARLYLACFLLWDKWDKDR